MGRSLLARLTCGVSLVAAAMGVAGPAFAAAEGVFVGVCTMSLTASFRSPVTVVPAPNVIGVTGTGTCVVNGVVAPLAFTATLATTPLTGGYSCLGGVATGTGVVQIDVPGFPDPLVQVTLVQVGSSVTLTLVQLLLTYEGVAELVQDAGSTLACPTVGMSQATWTGVTGFQDPYPPLVG